MPSAYRGRNASSQVSASAAEHLSASRELADLSVRAVEYLQLGAVLGRTPKLLALANLLLLESTLLQTVVGTESDALAFSRFPHPNGGGVHY